MFPQSAPVYNATEAVQRRLLVSTTTLPLFVKNPSRRRQFTTVNLKEMN